MFSPPSVSSHTQNQINCTNKIKSFENFENGKKKSSDLIIIANGIKSDLRSYVDKSAHPQYAEYVGWRGVVNEEEISSKSLETLSNYFIIVLPHNQQIACYPIAGEGENPFEIGKRRINWIWYKPIPTKLLKELLLKLLPDFNKETDCYEKWMETVQDEIRNLLNEDEL